MNMAIRIAEMIRVEGGDPHGRPVNIGPECFAWSDGSAICWRGVNYTPQRTSLRVRLHNLLIRLGSEGA